MLHIEQVPHQGTYTPLSQGDSDSEEQLFLRQQQPIHNFNNKRSGNKSPTDSFPLQQNPQFLQLKRQQRQHYQRKLMQQQYEHLQQQQKFQTTGATHNNSGPHNNNTNNSINPVSQQPSSYTTNMQNTFRTVMMSDGDAGAGSNFSSFNSDSYDERNHIDADNVAILGGSNGSDIKTGASLEPMSPARRCCFAASLILCFLAIFSFVWLVPCNEEGTCPSPIDRTKTQNWLTNYTKIELKGGINVVSGARSWENNLIFLYRGDQFFPESLSDHKERNGIISLFGSSGQLAWYEKMVEEPIAIDCSLLDVDRNGQYDCLVMDIYGELRAINPSTGQCHWLFNEHSIFQVTKIDFPVILPDLDDDGVLEILMVTEMDSEERTKTYTRKGDVKRNHYAIGRNYLRLISGRTGTSIGEGFEVSDCEFVRKLEIEHLQKITYTCYKNNTEARRSKTLAELFALITNKSLMSGQQKIVNVKAAPAMPPLATNDDIDQYRHFGQRGNSFDTTQRNVYSLSGRELVIENRGSCPEDCNVTFILSAGLNGKVAVLRNFTKAGMYGMAPLQWHFKNSKPEMSGFVMKFWKWKTPMHGVKVEKYGESEHPEGEQMTGNLNEPAEASTTAAPQYSSTVAAASKSVTAAATTLTPTATSTVMAATEAAATTTSTSTLPSTATSEATSAAAAPAAASAAAAAARKPTLTPFLIHAAKDIEYQRATAKKVKSNMVKDNKENTNSKSNYKSNHENPNANHNPAVKTSGAKDDNKANNYNNYSHGQRKQQHMHHMEQLADDWSVNSMGFKHFIEKRHSYAMPTATMHATASDAKRNKAKNSKVAANKQRRQALSLSLDNYRLQSVTESVLLIVFIGPHTHFENTSQSNIVQFCGDFHKVVVCQPDVYNHENSMIIADLDQDGSQELVSYMSTYIEANDDSLDYKLVTYVRLLRLQSELPGIYASSKKKLL